MDFVRDPRYWIPFVALIAIIAVAAVMRNSDSSEAKQAVGPDCDRFVDAGGRAHAHDR